LRFSDSVLKHRRAILFLLVLLLIGGAFAYNRLPSALFPQVQFPRVRVQVNAGSQPAQQMMMQVTRKVERAVRAVPGVRSVRSNTSRGSTDVSINFDWGHNMVHALLLVESAVNQLKPDLPPNTRIKAKRMYPADYTGVIAYSLTSDKKSQVSLYDLARYKLVPYLSSVKGVAKVTVQGGKQAEYRVSINPARLHALNLTTQQIINALSSSNVLQSVGRVEDHDKLYLTLSSTRLTSAKSIRQTVLKTGKNGQVTLSDVAKVRLATQPKYKTTTANGHKAVLLNVYQKPGASVVKLSRDLKKRLHSFGPKMPADVHIAQWRNLSNLVKRSRASVIEAIVIGVVLAAVVLLIFLRSVRITLVAIIGVPAVLVATMLLLYVFGMSLNIMTLGGMAAAVGLIIDDIIVMVEQIVRRIQETGEQHLTRILASVREFTHPQIGSSTSTIIIFFPLAFLSGVTGAFFKALSLTMAVSLIISFFMAWTIVPLLADFVLGNGGSEPAKPSRIGRRTLRGYTRLMVRLLRQPAWLLVGLAPFLIVAYFALNHVGSGFLPKMDEGAFILDYRSPPGTSLQETNRLLRQVAGILKQDSDIQNWSRRTGLQLGGAITTTNAGDFFVRLKPSAPSTSKVMAHIRKRVNNRVPGLDIDLAQPIADEIGDLTAVPQPIDIRLFGDKPKQLRTLARKVAGHIQKIPGVVGVHNGVVIAGDSIRIHVNRVKAATEGLSPQAVTQQLKAYTGGVVATRVRKGVRYIGVRVRGPQKLHTRISQLRNLKLHTPGGNRVRLSKIASVKTISGQPELTRYDLKSDVAVTARISGRSLGKTIADVKKVLNQPGMIPKSNYYKLGGLYKQQQKAFRGLIEVFVAAAGLVFLLLLILYQRFRIAIVIITQPILATCAVFVGLWFTGIERNITAMMGMTMVIGIVTEIAIFYFSEFQLISTGNSFATDLVRAGRNRLRPITMSALAFVLSLVPLAIGIGNGTGVQRPLAVAIISGLLAEIPLVLVVMPVLYNVLCRSHRIKIKWPRRLEKQT